MTRMGLLSIVLAAAVTGACGGSDSMGSSPTAPSSASNSASQPTSPASCPPSAPSNLAVASQQGTVITLQWSAPAGATEYSILVGSTPSSSDLLSTNTSQTNYTWTAKSGRQYARVQARGPCGAYSGSSNEVEFTAGN
jgi:hypothetical protein